MENNLKQIPQRLKFDIEIYKFGKSLNKLTMRYGILIRDEGFFTSHTKEFNKIKSKDKTEILLNSILKTEKKNKQKDWSNSSKEFRIILEFQDDSKKTKKNYIYLYFDNIQQLEQTKEIIFAIKSNKKKNEKIITNLKSMQKMTEASFLFYGVFKMLEVRQRIKNRKIYLNFMKNHYENNLEKMKKFGQNLFNNVTNYYLKNKKIFIDRMTFPKYKFLFNETMSQYLEKNNNNFNFKTIEELKKNVKILQEKFRNFLDYKKINLFYSNANENVVNVVNNKNKILSNNINKNLNFIPLIKNKNKIKHVLLKLQKTEYKFPHINSIIPQNIKLSFPTTINTNNQNLTINKNNLEIIFNDSSKLTQKDILQISSIFLNLDINDKISDNYLTICGPRKNPKKFFKYSYKPNTIQIGTLNIKDKFIEPEFHSLNFTNNINQNRILNIQIFHSIFLFEKRDFENLENILKNNSISDTNFNYINPIDDFYFFIEISFQKNSNIHKIRTKLVKAKSYVKNSFIIEFNLTHFVNLDQFEVFDSNMEMKVCLNLIPKILFSNNLDEKEMNFYVDYLNSYDLGSFTINKENIFKNEYEFNFKKDGVNLSEENKIIMNFYIENINNNLDNFSYLNGKNFNVGNDIFILETLTKEFFQNKINDDRIDMNTKDKFYNIKFSEDDQILLKLPNSKKIDKNSLIEIKIDKNSNNNNLDREELIAELCKNSNISEEELKKILHNSNFNFIPNSEKYINKNLLKSSKNLKSSFKEILATNPSSGDWIYKLKNIKKFFLCNFKGITENKTFVYHNHFSNEIKAYKIDDHLDDLNKKFRIVQENLFNIYNFNEIEIINENNINDDIDDTDERNILENYHWKIGLHFKNKLELETFIILLKDLRRRSNHKFKLENNIISNPININSLKSMSKTLTESLKSLRISLVQIEFRQSFELKENKKMSFKLSKGNNINNINKFLLESLDQSENYNYQNSLINNEDIKKEIYILQNLKKSFQILPKIYELEEEKFNKSQKILEFKNIIKNDFLNKTFKIKIKNENNEFEKNFILEIILNGKKEQILNANINLENVINSNPIADYFMIPIFEQDSKIVIGILHLNCWMVNEDEIILDEELHFNNLFTNYISNLKLIKQDDFGNFIKFGRYEPNVYRRLILKKIKSEFNKDLNCLIENLEENGVREKLYLLLKEKCVKFADDLINNNVNRWKDLIIDNNLMNKNLMKKYYFIKMRNKFYQQFSKSEWLIFLRKIFDIDNKNKQKYKSNFFINLIIYSVFPKKSEILKMKIKQNKLYTELRFLYYLGLPQEVRSKVWDKILDIEKLCSITKEKIKDLDNLEDLNKEELFNHFKNLSKTEFNINFSLIENDLNFLEPISENKNEINSVHNIAKAFFIWSELNITTDKYVAEENNNKKFVYFFGILKIIQKLNSVIKNESETFWIIIGLSQIIGMFYQSDPLNTDELTYSQMYVLISKLIMENNLRLLYSKFLELGFPIEYFFVKLISSLYADIFHTELFMRLLDIIIFEAALKTNKYDRYDYLRVICTIPLTLLKKNEEKLLECQTVREMEILFDDLIWESLNNQNFLENLRENVDKFYEKKSLFDLFQFKNVNYTNEVMTWDDKRNTIEKHLKIYFYDVFSENENLLKFLRNCNFSLDFDFVENYEKEIEVSLNSIRKVYGCNNLENLENLNDNHGFYFYFNELHFFNLNFNQNDIFNNEIYLVIEYNNLIIPLSDFSKDISNNNSHLIKFNLKNGKILNSKILLKSFPNNLNKYMNLLLISKNIILGQYAINIQKLDLMKSHKLKLESLNLNLNQNDNFKSILEILIFKYSLEKVNDQDSDLFNFIFNEPNYIYDTKLNNEIDEVKILNENEIKLINTSTTTENLNDIQNLLKIKEKFIYEEYRKNNNLFNKIKTEKIPKIEELIKNLFSHTNNNNLNSELISQLIFKWLSKNESTFEEILHAIILVDCNSITIYEKLKLLFDINKSKNFLLFNDDKMTIIKLKELIYSLYKRFMVYFTKSDVDKLVDYILNKENLNNFKFVIIYNKNKSEIVENIINENDHINYNIISFLNKEKVFRDLRKNLVTFIETLKNQFGLKNLKINLIENLANFIIGKNISDGVDEMRIILESDNIRKSLKFEIKILKDKGIIINKLIKEDFDTNLEDDNNQNVIKKILLNDKNTLEISNQNLNEISFDEFKDIFFNLPFISDLFRASLGFNHIIKKEMPNYIKSINRVKLEITYPYRKESKFFIFSKNKNLDKNMKNYYHINTNLMTSINICEITQILIQKLKEEGDIEQIEEFAILKMYFNNPKLMSFYIINNNNEEKMRFYDSLYSNNFIRNSENIKEIRILIKLGKSDNINDLSKEKIGFAKLKFDSDYYQWRECIIANIDGENLVKFKSFDNKCKMILFLIF